MGKRKLVTDKETLKELIEEGTVDAYGEYEQQTGMLTVVQDSVVCPFDAKVIGEKVRVKSIEWAEYGEEVMAVCESKGKEYEISLNSIEFIEPLPEGYEWIEAFQLWVSGGRYED